MSSKKLGWKILLSGASLAAMGALSGPAFAQNNTAAAPADQNSDEIIVTATGRAAALQDVPVAVTAIGAGQVENSGAHDLRDLTQLAPSFEMGTGQSNSSGTIARIRGIGTGSDNPGFEGAVGIFIDGVYRARAGAALTDLPELERVEILRGPQGTLFGRNTSSGAINVVTAGPDFTPGVSMDVVHGELNQNGARGMVNVPLNETLAIRLDGSVRDRDGWITDFTSGNDINTTNRWSGRGQMLWDISPNATLRIIADGAATHEVCCGITPLVYGTTQAVINEIVSGTANPLNPAGMVPGFSFQPSATQIGVNTRVRDSNMTVTPGRNYNERTQEQGISGQLDWDLGFGHLTSITSDRSWQSVRNQDIDFNVIDISYRDGLRVAFQNFSQEVRLQGDMGRLNWLFGAYYGDEKLHQTDTIRVGTQVNQYTSFAVMGGTASTFGAPGCELFNFTAANSIFQCAVGLLPVLARPAALTAVNSSNGGYILPNAPGMGQQADIWSVHTQNWALFTHDEINITDRLQLTVGARYNSETKDLGANLNSTANSCTSLQAMENATVNTFGPGVGVVTFLDTVANGAFSSTMNLACNPAINTISNGLWSGSSTENFWTYLASLSYHLNDDTMVYAGYSRGYKAGGYNVDRSGFSVLPHSTSPAALNTGQLHFDPEFTDSYEIGIRTSPFGRGSTFNVTAFYEQIHDYQLNAFNGFNFITRNVPDVISKGVEIEGSVRPFEGLSLTAGATYNDAYYNSQVRFSPLTAPLGANDPNAVFSGEELSFAPKWVVTGGVTYELRLGSTFHAMFYLDGRWNDGYRTQTLARDPLGRTDNNAFAVFNGRIGVGPRDDRWSIELWARNLTDQFYYVGAFQPPLQNSYVVYPSEPRTVGLEFRGHW